jgi:uncharacterized protein YqgC (DUF456 family)
MTSVLVPAVLMLVGLIGIVVPVLPGLFLVWLATALWAFEHPSRWAWAFCAVAALVYAAGLVAQYLLPGRRLKDAGVGTSTMLLAAVFAVVGFFLIPVVGAVLGFVLGIFVVESSRHRDRAAAWASTKGALRAVAMSVGIEMAAGFAIVLIWLVGVWQLGIPG